MALERLMTTAEVATYLGVSVNTLYQWRYRGEGPAGVRVGNRVRYEPAEIQRYLRAQRAAQRNPAA